MGGLLRTESTAACPVDRHCSEWARKNMGFCLCGPSDYWSLGLGLVSVVSWGVAEIPQIITNYRTKSAEGLSILFLTTWIVGDFFNLFGCMLEPATLPTQYYMAVLFLITTVVLFSQAVYYGHIYPRLKSNKRSEGVHTEAMERNREKSYGLDTEKVDISSLPIPIVSISPNESEGLFFMSARSLSVCNTPPAGSFLASRTPTLDVERPLLKEPLLLESVTPPKVKTTLCVVSLMVFSFGSCIRQLAESHKNAIFESPTGGIVLRVGRRLLEAEASESNGFGTFLGWGMAAIYMGGRFPQILLNLRRGNAKGLNPLMFIFALVGNITYVASILVKSVQWSKIHPNLPWLVESGGCVLLDIIILFQFFYYPYRRTRSEVGKYVS